MTDDGGVAFFYEIVGYVFTSDSDSCGVTSLEAFSRGLGIVDLNVYLSLELAHLREYRFTDETFAKVFFDLELPCRLFRVVRSTIRYVFVRGRGTLVAGCC